MRFRLDVPHTLPGDRYLDAGTIIGTGTDYPLPEDYEPSQHVTALDEEAEEVLAAREIKPDPLSEAALPSRIRPEDAMIKGKPSDPNKDLSPSDDGSEPDLSLPKTNENLSGGKPKK